MGNRSDRVLAVLPDHPHPADMGSRVRNLGILAALSERFRLTIVTLVHDLARLDDPGPVARLGRWVPVPAPHRRGRSAQLWWHLRGAWSAWREGLHRETFFQSLPVLSETVTRLLAEETPGIVHVAYWYTLRHLRALERPPFWVVDTHDVQFERHARLWGRESPRERAAEVQQLSRYDRVVAITERDRRTLARALPPGAPPVEVIGMGLDLDWWKAGMVPPVLPDRPRVAFYGNLATGANQDAARHFLREILPRVRARVPGTEGVVIGGSPPPAIRREAEKAGAGITGFVDDPRPWLQSASVLALTLRAASGQRGRMVEALALGLPVVGYPEALDGIDLEPGDGFIAASDPDGFARVVVGLLRDPDAVRALAARGRRGVEARYSRAETYGKFPVLYERMMRGA